MDMGFPQGTRSKPDSGWVDCTKLVLVKDAAAAAAYQKLLWPIYVNAVLISADGTYPLDADLRARAFATLAEDPHAVIIVFNFDSTKQLSIATNRLLVMDDLLLSSRMRSRHHQRYDLELDCAAVAKIMHSFYSQWNRLEQANNFTESYATFKDYTSFDGWEFRDILLGQR
jgi:hypothetical protein